MVSLRQFLRKEVKNDIHLNQWIDLFFLVNELYFWKDVLKLLTLSVTFAKLIPVFFFNVMSAIAKNRSRDFFKSRFFTDRFKRNKTKIKFHRLRFKPN